MRNLEVEGSKPSCGTTFLFNYDMVPMRLQYFNQRVKIDSSTCNDGIIKNNRH